ncbi:MAG: ribonuclease HI family protein [Candidatus Sumerlaeia bacterium]|nr:ribonuclease HI family protein [Candidatus Sumerlaeia bacterium]
MSERLSPSLAKLAKTALRLPKTGIPLSRIVEILAQPDGDISTVANRLPRVDNTELRQGLAALARFLRELEKETNAGKPPQPDIALPTTTEVFPTDAPTVGPDVKIERVKMFIDGGSHGNPGPAAIGIVFTDMAGHTLWQISRRLEGPATNNVAEYEALRQGLLCALGQGWRKVHVFSDSELLVRQMLGHYKIKNEGLRQLAPAIQRLIRQFDTFTIAHISREQNRLADRLVAHALKE